LQSIVSAVAPDEVRASAEVQDDEVIPTERVDALIIVVVLSHVVTARELVLVLVG
jgi:hypothetical protein